MAKKIPLTQEEVKQQYLGREIEDVRKKIEIGSIPKNPTRLFSEGDSVLWGNHHNVTVVKVLFEGLAYHLHYDYMGETYGKPSRKEGDHVLSWIDVFPKIENRTKEQLSIKDDIWITFANNDISSLLHKVYASGVDFNPDYQRDLVWNIDQKTSLLDSIFNSIDIGKFTFIRHEWSPERVFYYEILDGKQRLSTILEFYEDRITWRGMKFSELSWIDSHHFTGFPIIQGEVSQITEQQIYKLFIKMNTSGTPVSKEHLDRIKNLITT